MPPGSNLKSTSSRSFIALSTKLVGVSAPPCAVVWEFEVTTKPKKICKNNPGVLMTGTKTFANLLRENRLSTWGNVVVADNVVRSERWDPERRGVAFGLANVATGKSF